MVLYPMLTRSAIVAGLRAMGLEESDTVLVHSACRKLGPVDGGVPTVLSALREAVSVTGTIVVPTYSFFVKWGPSEMGALTKLVALYPEAVAIPHPVHSFAAIGVRAKRLGAIRNVSSYGPNSLFAALTEADGKILIIGLSYQDSMTYFHYVEQTLGVPYREIQDLGDGYTIYGRKPGVETAVEPMGAVLEAAGVVSIGTIGDATCKLMAARDVFRLTAAHINDVPSKLHTQNAPTS